jgi:hypothetical protein
MRKKSHKRTIPINMREKEAKRVFIFVIGCDKTLLVDREVRAKKKPDDFYSLTR